MAAKAFSIYLDEKLVEKAKEKAEKDDRSFSYCVSRLLEKWVKGE